MGGGLAGLAATSALAGAGAKVSLLEWRPYWGGRAYSYRHPALEETIDSQHVVLGCCTNIIDLLEVSGAEGLLRWYEELLFLEPGGRRSVLRSGVLPAPLGRAGSMLRAPMLTLRDKAGIALGLTQFLTGYPKDDRESAAAWMRRTGQTNRAQRHFWEPIILATLNNTSEHCALKYAGKVFHEAFLRSTQAGSLGIPTVPLSELFSRVAEKAEAAGAAVRTRMSVKSLRRDGDKWLTCSANDEIFEAEAVVLATDYRSATALLSGMGGGEGLRTTGLSVAPITTVHLWFDREIAQDDQAALLDTRIQWMFNKSRIRGGVGPGTYLELVISGSFAELEMSREEILPSALKELQSFYPDASGARLLRSAVLKEARATFDVAPGTDELRPAQRTRWPGLFLAGDWTRTEWPSTMEGAVRAGRLAAGEIVGDRMRFMAQELPATGLMRVLSRA